MPQLHFQRRYAMAHRLRSDAASRCQVPHGHDQVVSVTLRVLRPLDAGRANMAASFAQAKGRWHGWIDRAVDHSFHLGLEDPLLAYFQAQEPERLDQVMTFRGDPTTEALAVAFWRKLTAFLALDATFALTRLQVQETPTNAVILEPADVDALGGWSPGAWCLRPDDSLNDL